MYKEEIYFWPSTFCVDGNNIWFIYGKVCVLCCYNMETKKTEILSEIPTDDLQKESLYKKIIYKKGKLYLIPAWAKDILVYDIAKKSFKPIGIPQYNGLMFCNAFLYEDKIICTPFAYPAIVSIDTTDNQVDVLFDLKEIKAKFGISYFNMADNFEQKIAMVSQASNKCFVYDVHHRKLEVENVTDINVGYSSVAFFDGRIALGALKYEYIDLYNTCEKNVKKIKLLPEQVDITLNQINNNNLLLDDSQSASVWVYSNGFMKKISTDTIEDRSLYYSYKVGIYDKESGLYFNNCDATFYKDFKLNERFKIPITDSIREQISKIIRKNRIKNEIEFENEFYDLKNFLEELVR